MSWMKGFVLCLESSQEIFRQSLYWGFGAHGLAKDKQILLK